MSGWEVHLFILQWARQNLRVCNRRFHHRGVVGRTNQHPILDRLGRTSPPIPLLRPKSTLFQKRPKLGHFLENVPIWDTKTPHGYEAYLASFFFDGTGGMEIVPPLKSRVSSQPMVFPSTSPVSWFPSRAT